CSIHAQDGCHKSGNFNFDRRFWGVGIPECLVDTPQKPVDARYDRNRAKERGRLFVCEQRCIPERTPKKPLVAAAQVCFQRPTGCSYWASSPWPDMGLGYSISNGTLSFTQRRSFPRRSGKAMRTSPRNFNSKPRRKPLQSGSLLQAPGVKKFYSKGNQ